MKRLIPTLLVLLVTMLIAAGCASGGGGGDLLADIEERGVIRVSLTAPAAAK